MPDAIIIALIPLLPLISFLILGLYGKKFFKNTAGIIGTISLLVSFTLAAYTAFSYFNEYYNAGTYPKLIPFQYAWLQFSGSMSIDMGIFLDPISVMMIVVVTFISLMVHIYSLDYLKGEERFATYYSFLSLFTFSMLGLVLSSNIFQIYIFWELVGVSSFLLIGFYYDRPSAVAASKKSIHRNEVCRPWISDWHPYSFFLFGHTRFQYAYHHVNFTRIGRIKKCGCLVVSWSKCPHLGIGIGIHRWCR